MDETKGAKASSRDLSPAPEDARLSQRLHALERQLKEARPPPEVDRSQTLASGRTAIAMGLRVGAEFAAGVIGGAAIGRGGQAFRNLALGARCIRDARLRGGSADRDRSAGVVKPGPAGGDDFSGGV
jgi:hypothetical protein